MEFARSGKSVARLYGGHRWRNRSEFIVGREAIVDFLTRKWAKELDYRLIKDLWASTRIASRCASSTSGTTSGAWFRSYGNEQWEFDEAGLMQRREARINDVPIEETTGVSSGLRRGRVRIMSGAWAGPILTRAR